MGKTRTGQKYVVKDAYYHEAKSRGFVARSALKLEELDRKHHLYRKGMKILDLGCAPGSWLQYASRKVGPEGKLLGIDLEPVRVSEKNVKTIVGDLLEFKPENEDLSTILPVDLIQSDAMTKTTGIPDSDCARSLSLVEYGLWLAERGVLAPDGTFIAKVFEGPGFTPFYVAFKRKFRKCSVNKPEAIRKGSREIYIVGQGFRPGHA